MPKSSSNINLLSRQIFIFVSLVTKLAGRDHERRIAAQLPGISGLEYGVMQILKVQDRTLGELARMMLLASATLVPVVDRLENKKLVVRGADPHDRRRNPLRLTEKGRTLIGKASQFEAGDLMAQSLQAMGPEKVNRLNALLKELVQNLSPEEDVVGQVLGNLAIMDPETKE